MVTFDAGFASDLDYWSMIGMSSLLIAIDAMLIVLLSWSKLRTWKDVMGVACLVGSTHVVFPLFTFFLTVSVSWGAQALGLPSAIASGVQTSIFFVAFVFVAAHLREVNEAVREEDPETIGGELFPPEATLWSWSGLKALWRRVQDIWPIIFGVSLDALMVGPAKIAFMSRYTPEQFWWGFVLIGLGVFGLVMMSGVLVLILKKWFKKNEAKISKRVHQWDWIGSFALVAVFLHFTIFAAVYVLYTFIELPLILETWFIWTTTAIFFAIYLLFWRPGEIIEASRHRSGVVAP